MNKKDVQIAMVWTKLQWLKEGFPLDMVRRELALTIYEMTPNHTGYTSKSLLTEDGYRVTGKGVKPACLEHFLNLKKYTIQMCEEFLSGKIDSKEKMIKKLNQINNVHRVSSEENNKLRSVQTNYPELHWKEHYEMVGIELVREVGTFNRDTGKKRDNKSS